MLATLKVTTPLSTATRLSESDYARDRGLFRGTRDRGPPHASPLEARAAVIPKKSKAAIMQHLSESQTGEERPGMTGPDPISELVGRD